MSYTVLKLNHNGQEQLRYAASKLPIDLPNGIALRAVFSLHVTTSYTTFAPGDVLHEYFYTARYYNVFALYDGDSTTLKGWYCNICRPAVIQAMAVRCDDLALDVWVWPDGRTLVLDEDEFEVLGLSAEERAKCLAAVEKIEKLAANNLLPR